MNRSMTTMVPALASLLPLTFTCVSHATSYKPPSDFDTVSPNGQYRFVADYPDPTEPNENRKPDITFTLYEVGTGVARWSLKGDYKTQLSETWPNLAYGAYVGNNGGVLIYGPTQRGFTALAAADGKVGPRMTYDFKAPYTQQPAVFSSSAKRQFMRYSFRGMVEAEGQSYLLTRACWGERRLIGFTEQTLITELTKAQNASCNATERQWVRSTLMQAPKRLDNNLQAVMSWLLTQRDLRSSDPRRPKWQYEWDLQLAMQMASRFGYQDMIPELRAIERWRPTIPEDQGLTEKDVRAIQSSGRPLLRTARLALRRLGERPANHQPLIYIFPAWRDGIATGERVHDDLVEFPDVIAFTDADLASVSKGMPVRKVIELLGAPDSMQWALKNRCVLEFDIDTDKPFTLRIRYALSIGGQIPPTVESTERITPPRWTIEARRDMELDWGH